jgi:hypothetical protein
MVVVVRVCFYNYLTPYLFRASWLNLHTCAWLHRWLMIAPSLQYSVAYWCTADDISCCTVTNDGRCHAILNFSTVTIENLFQVQWKNCTFHLHEFSSQPFNYNPLIYIEGYSELAASPNMHMPRSWKITERIEIFNFCQNVVEIFSLLRLCTALVDLLPTLKGQAAQECYLDCLWWDVCSLFELITMLVQKHINRTPSH